MKPEPAFPSARAPAASPGGNGECDGERPPAALPKELPGAVYRCRNDADWTVEFISDGCLALTGYRADELTGSRVTSLGALMHPGDAAAVWEKCQASLAARQPCSNEYRILHRTGETRWVWDQAHGVYSPGGGLLHIEGLLMDITPRKRAEAALRIREEWLRLSLRAANIGLWDWDVITNQVAYSPEWKSQLGYAAEEIGSAFAEWESRVHPDDLAPTLERVRRALAAGETAYEVEFRMRHKDGAWRWIYTRAEIFRDDRGQAVRVIGCHVDITERRQAEENLRRAEERYRSIFEHAVEGIYQSTPAGRYLTVNPAMAGIYGYASPEAMVQEVTDIGRQIYADPEDRRKLQALLHAQGGLGVFECQMRRRDGSLIWIRQSARALRDASGQVICFEGSVEDITERREAEEELRRQHALVTAVVEGTSDAVFAKDLAGRYLIINAAGARALGRPAAEILGHTDAEFVPEATARRFREADAVVVASGQAQTQEETGMMAGVRRAWHAAKSPLRDAEGRIIGVIGVSRDITEQKQAEAERARLWSVLEASLNEIYVFDAQSLRFEYVNAAALRNLGYSAGAMRTLTPLDLKPAFTAATFAELVQPLRRHEREEVVFQTEHHRADGSRYPVEVHLQLVDNGGPPVFLAIINDLTERKQAEAELVQLSGRLLRAQDAERRRLAREIHDSTAQTFAALAMNLAVLDRSAAGLDEAGRALLAECETQVRRGTAELRTLAYLLHPPALEALGLARAIHDYAEGFARRSGVRVELDVAEPPDRLPPETELALFRVLQESLGNLHRHSGSATAAIRLAQDAETVVIEVRDTGRGLAAAALAAANSGSARFGVGIAGMRERLRLLGGRLEIEAALPGVRVRATLPLPATADE